MDRRSITITIFFILVSGFLLFSCATTGEKISDSHKVSIVLKDSGEINYCPKNYYLTGAFYSDINGGPDKSVKKLECTKFNIPGYQLREIKKNTYQGLEMNGNGTNWYYLPEGHLVAGAYYSNSDYSVEKFIYTKPVVYLKNNKCTIHFRNSSKIQMQGHGTNWYSCPQNYFVTGAYYKDDDNKGTDDSV